MSDQIEHSSPSRPRRKRKNYSLLILAAGIFLFGAAAGGLYYCCGRSLCGSPSVLLEAMTRNWSS